MVKKIVLGVLLFGLVAFLVVGGIIRTVDKTGNVAEARGLGGGEGYGQGAGHADDCDNASQGNGGAGREAQGRGGGNGSGGGNATEQAAYFESAANEYVVYEGVVVESPTEGGELVIQMDSGEEVLVGTGPGYMEAQGFALQVGERVQVQGYLEGDELKAAQVTRLRDGETIMLRDQTGRPAWSGAGQRAAKTEASAAQGGLGQGQSGGAQGGYRGEGNTDAPGDGTGTGQAQVDEWVTLSATVLSADSYELVVQAADGQEIVMSGQPWRFALEQGLVVQAGNQLSLTGFYENGDLEAGQIENVTSGQVIQIRDESGRPLWAGRGRQAGGQ